MLRLAVTTLTLLSIAGCPPPETVDPNTPVGDVLPQNMVASIELPGTPTAIAVDAARNRALVGSGVRLRSIHLETLELEAPTGSGSFHAIDEEDDKLGYVSPEDGRIRNFRSYPASLLEPPGRGTATGMTYNPVNHSVYVVDVAPLGRAVLLLELDVETDAFTQIGEPGLQAGLNTVFSLARDPASGMLYTVDVEDRLWRIDPAVGVAERVGGFVGFTNIQGLSFSPDGALYGVHSVNPPELVVFDLAAGTATSVGQLPLSYTFGSLAFKPDGTLWAVDLPRDALVQINPTNGAIVQEFEPLPVSRPNFVTPYFLGIDALTWVPDENGAGFGGVESLTIGAGGEVYTSSGNTVSQLGTDLLNAQTPLSREGLLTFDVLRFNPTNERVYTRDGIEATIFEIDPLTWDFTNTYVLHENFGSFPSWDSSEMAIDNTTGRVFVRDPVALYVLEPSTGTVSEIPFAEAVPTGVAVDSVARRLYLNLQAGFGENLVVLDLDTFEELGRRALGVQVFELLVDEQRGRLFANARTQVPAFDTTVFVLDTNLEIVDASIRLAEEDAGTATTVAQLALDSARNRLLVARGGGNNRVDVYQLPE